MQPEPSDHDKNKADEEFLQYSSRFSPLSPLKALTAIGLPLALYQILTGFIYSSNQASLFNISLTISGFFTLTLLGLALNWIRSAVNDGEKEMVLFDKKRESLSTLSFLIFSILKLGTAPLMISNLILQKNYVGDYLTASSGANAFDELGAPLITQHESAGTLNTLAVLFIVTEVVFFFYAMFATATTFSFVKRPRKMHANFTYIANAVLLGAALSLAFTASRSYNLENYSRLENLFPSWNLKALLGLGVAASGLTFAVWLVNFRKWRIGFFAMALILGNLGLLSLVFTGFAYSHSNGVYQHYSNTENMKQLQGRMSYVSQEELTNYGCPAKYLPQENCGNSMLLTAWESDAQTGGSESCLNIKCAGLLGQIYSDKFTQVANWGLLTAVTSILMAGSLLYSSVNRGAFKHERRSRKNFSWLALLGTVGIVCVLTYGLNPAQNIQEYKQENNLETTEAWSLGSLFSGIRAPTITTPSVTMPTVRMPSVTMPSISMPTVRMPTLTVPTLTVPSLSTIGQDLSNALGLNNNVAYQVAQMTQSKDSRYIILNPNVATKQVEVSKTGAISETYQNFVDSLDSQKSQLGLVRTTVNGQEQVVGILWAPKTAPTAEQDLLVKTFVPDYSSVSYSDTLKVPIVVAADKTALTIANIESKLATLQTSKAWGLSDIQDAADDYSSTLRAPGAPGPGVKNMKTWGWQDINAAVDQYQAGADAAQELGEENIDSLRAPGAPGPGLKNVKTWSWGDVQAAQDAADDYSSTLRAPGAPGPGVKNMKTWGWQEINAAVDQYQAGADAAQELGEENIDSLRAPGAPGPGVKNMKTWSWGDVQAAQDAADDYSSTLRAPGAPGPGVKNMKTWSWGDVQAAQDAADDYSSTLRAPGAPGPGVKNMKTWSWGDVQAAQDAADDYSSTLRAPGAPGPGVKNMKTWSWGDVQAAQDAADDYSSTLRAPGAPGPGVKNMKTWGWQDINAAVDQYQTAADATEEQAADSTSTLRAPGAPGPGVKNMKTWSWGDVQAAQEQAEDYNNNLRAKGAPSPWSP